VEEGELEHTIPNHVLGHSTILQPDVALELDPHQPLSWALLALPEAASFDALHGNFTRYLSVYLDFHAWLFCLVLR